MSLEVLFRVYNDASRDIDAAVAVDNTVPLNDPAAVPATSKGWVGGMPVRANGGALSPQGNGLFFGPGVDAAGFPAQQAPQDGTVSSYAVAAVAASAVGFLGLAKNDLAVELFGSPASGGNGTTSPNSLTPSKASVEMGGGSHKIKPTVQTSGLSNYPFLYLTAGITDYAVGDVLKIETNTGKWANLTVATVAAGNGDWETGNGLASFATAPVRATVTGLDSANQALIVKVAG